MANAKEKKKSEKKNGQNPGIANDQLGENSGSGRLMKERGKNGKNK